MRLPGRQQSVLYITRNGLLEPLGQSQVMSYLRGLSQDYAVTLITFEKPEDWADQAAVAEVRSDCEAHGIYWSPRRFHHRPRLLAPAWSMAQMAGICLREAWRGRTGLIHARSYVPAMVAMGTGCLSGVPFIFDMRALWPEELITAERLRRGSLLHQGLVRAERACLRRAAAVVSLTRAAVDHLREVYPSELSGQEVAVIPTCADLDRFRPPKNPLEGPPIYGCVGTVLSGWFRLDWLGAFFEAVARQDPKAIFHVVTRDDPVDVRERIDSSGVFGERLEIYSKPASTVHEAVQLQVASVMFFSTGKSKLGSSPTRMGEILGCGIPVVANEGVGDVARIVRTYDVGVLVAGNDEESMNNAVCELDALRSDPNLSARCRRAAEELFSLEAGTEAYRALYHRVLASAEA